MQPFSIDEYFKLLLKISFSSALDKILKNNFPSTFKRDIGLKSLMLFGSGLPEIFGDINLSINSLWNGYNTIFKTRLKQIKQIITNIETEFVYFIRNHLDSRSRTISMRVEYFFKVTEREIF